MRSALRAMGLAAVVASCALPPPQLDLNGASAKELRQVPGIGQDEADRIVAGRPYASKDDLLRRHVLTTEQYDSVAGSLYVGPPGMPDYLRSVPPAAEGP